MSSRIAGTATFIPNLTINNAFETTNKQQLENNTLRNINLEV